MKSKSILVALICIGLSVPISAFAQSGTGQGSSNGGGLLSTHSLRFSPRPPISVVISDNEQIDAYFILYSVVYEVDIMNRFGQIVYRRRINTQFTQQLTIDIKSLPTNSYVVTFKNVATNEVSKNRFQIK